MMGGKDASKSTAPLPPSVTPPPERYVLPSSPPAATLEFEPPMELLLPPMPLCTPLLCFDLCVDLPICGKPAPRPVVWPDLWLPWCPWCLRVDLPPPDPSSSLLSLLSDGAGGGGAATYPDARAVLVDDLSPLSPLSLSDTAAAAAACRFSMARSSANHGWRSAWRAEIRSSGSYASSFSIMSTPSRDTCGSSLAMPVPSVSGKLKSIVAA
mmetsp:Transcript_9686/g.34048  ORF Transcript_9686/g.34048 Transcript_9686/m.34048 type:complete len:211 (-) Transcript_9686:1111-1743(-)